MKERKEKEYHLDLVTPDFIFTNKKISPVLYFIHSSYFSILLAFANGLGVVAGVGL